MTAELRIDASVRVDAAQATAALGQVEASNAAVATSMRATGAAAAVGSAGLTEHATASRGAAAAAAELAAQVRPAVAALQAERAAAVETKAATDALSASERASAAAAHAAASAHGAMGNSVGFSRVQLLELGHIGTSLVDQLAAGANPLRALALESGRIGQVTAGSGGPIKAFGALVSLLGGPLVVGAVAATAAIAGLGAYLSHAQSEAVKLQRALDIGGNQAGLLADDVGTMGERIAAATKTSTAAATEAVGKLATSGKFTRDEIEQLGAAAVGLAARTGETADKVTAAFAKMADGPTAYARQYAAAYVGLSAATVEHIRQLEDTGQKGEALKVLSKALYDQLGTEAPGKLGFLERAWDAVAGAVGRATKAVLAYGATDTSPVAATNQLAADIQKRIDGIKASSAVQRGFGDISPTSASEIARGYARQLSPNEQIAVLEQQKAAALGLSAATAAASRAQQEANKVQRDGTAAAADLAEHYGKVGDNARRGAEAVAKFRAELAAALKANPTDPTLLDYQRRAPAIEKDILDKASPEATAAGKKAATAAAEAEKARAKKFADLAATITLIEGEAAAAATVKETREGELKVLELRKQYGALFTAEQEQQVRQAYELKIFYTEIAKVLQDAAKVELPDPTAVFAAQRTAAQAFDRKRQAGVEDPQTIDDLAANAGKSFDDAFDVKAGHKFGESAAQQFQSTAGRIGQLIGDAAGGRIGGELSRAIASAARGISSAPGGLSGFGQDVQQGFKDFNKETAKTLGNLFTDVFGSKGSDFGKTVGTAFAGASTGQLAGSIVGALGVKTSNAGSEIGGAIGGIAYGPLGSLIGGVAGGILGGLFGKKATSNSDVLTSATTAGSISGSNSIQQTAAKGLGNQVQNGLDQIAQALGGTLHDFGAITIGQRNDNYRVDTTGATIGKYNGKDFGTGDAAAAAAVSYAVEVALQRGAITGLSAHVQAVISQYGDDLNKAVTEALKVKNLEDIVANAANPYATAFRDFEAQAKQRVQVATQYGFDVVKIEKINADARAKLLQDTLSQATASVKTAIDDLKFGSRATGSIVEQRASLTAEEARLKGLVDGGDSSQLGALTSIVQQLVDLDKQAYGSTAAYATSRDSAVTLLQGLVDQTSAKITAAADAAAGTTTAADRADPSAAALAELNATGDDTVAQLQKMNGTVAGLPAAIAAALAAGGSLSGLSAAYARASVK